VRVIVPTISAPVPVVVTRNAVPSNAVKLDFILGARALPQSVYITPDEAYVGVEDVREFTLVDQQGREVSDVVWKTDDPKVAVFTYVSDADANDDSAPRMLIGPSPGKVIITATSQSGTAQAIAWVHPE